MSTQHQSLTSKVFDLFQYEKVLQNSTIGFLLLLQLANKRKKLFIYRKRAHGLLKEGAPHVREWAAKWGRVGCHLSSLQTSVKTAQGQGRGRHLHQQGAATSRGRHLSKRGAPPKAHMLNQMRFPINQVPIKWILSPLTS
jgi:hypothetical protein